MERRVKIEYQNRGSYRTDRGTIVKTTIIRSICPDQCWEIDPDRTVLTQYIARHPDSISTTETFAVGDIVRIDGIVYTIKDTLSGYFGVGDGEWYVSSICYYLEPLPPDTVTEGIIGWKLMPGNIIEPMAVPAPTTKALYNQRVRKKDEVYDIDAELEEARHRFWLVVTELGKIRRRKP